MKGFCMEDWIQKDKHKKLVEAFENPDFQKKVNQYRYDIELELNKFIRWLKGELDSNQKIFYSPESRIKSTVSFEEKIYRKNYINKWSLDGDEKQTQDEILKKLPDLIGFRITCYFMDDEEVIYKKLQQYTNESRFKDIYLDFSENTRQKNGKLIFKVSGKFQNTVSFEIQIKAATHNVWGEVEHRAIYKGRQFSINQYEKKVITDEIYNVLRASDQQLLALFKNNYTQENLICALFAEQTRKTVKNVANTDYLAAHYTSFFNIFLSETKDFIQQYVAAKLSNGHLTYTKKTLVLKEAEDKDFAAVELIKSTFIEYYLRVQFCIAQELYEFESYEQFLLYMEQVITKPFHMDTDEDYIEGDVFAELPEDKPSYDDYSSTIISVLIEKLPASAKEGD